MIIYSKCKTWKNGGQCIVKQASNSHNQAMVRIKHEFIVKTSSPFMQKRNEKLDRDFENIRECLSVVYLRYANNSNYYLCFSYFVENTESKWNALTSINFHNDKMKWNETKLETYRTYFTKMSSTINICNLFKNSIEQDLIVHPIEISSMRAGRDFVMHAVDGGIKSGFRLVLESVFIYSPLHGIEY